ncbi:MAG: hypothetical protein ABL903_06055 [Methylococcales bacterium]
MNPDTDYPKLLKLLTMLSLLALSACTSTPKIQTPETPAVTNDQTIINKIPKAEGDPPMTILKAGKPMQLVRMMEGGACKNPQQGVKGVFLLYADADDVQRIKTQQGNQVFAEFEKTITDFSVVALQTVVNKINFGTDTPNSDPKVTHQNLTQQFQPLFQAAIASSITNFQTKSTLKIAVQPFDADLVFYKNGCEATKDAQENEPQNIFPSI